MYETCMPNFMIKVFSFPWSLEEEVSHTKNYLLLLIYKIFILVPLQFYLMRYIFYYKHSSIFRVGVVVFSRGSKIYSFSK